MTIEEIKEWREDNLKFDRGIDTADIKFEIIDTLLAEVDRLQAQPHAVGEWHNADDVRKLTVATEALESLISANTQRITTARYIARTALERIKE